MIKKYHKHATLFAAGIFVTLAVIAGCNESARKNRPASAERPSASVQTYEISGSSNLVAQTRSVITVEADIYFPNLARPVRTKLRIMPGTWVVPEQMINMPKDDGLEIVCNDRYCEVVEK